MAVPGLRGPKMLLGLRARLGAASGLSTLCRSVEKAGPAGVPERVL
jgi:hypothetical protein